MTNELPAFGSSGRFSETYREAEQFDFLPILGSVEIRAPLPTRTMREALVEDFLQTVGLIRCQLTIASGVPKDYLREALVWCEEKGIGFRKEDVPRISSKLPFPVLVNYNTISVWGEAWLDLGDVSDGLVSFLPLTKGWEKDVLKIVRPCLREIRSGCSWEKRLVLSSIRTRSYLTRPLELESNRLVKYQAERFELADLLTKELYFHYWTTLTEREKS